MTGHRHKLTHPFQMKGADHRTIFLIIFLVLACASLNDKVIRFGAPGGSTATKVIRLGAAMILAD